MGLFRSEVSSMSVPSEDPARRLNLCPICLAEPAETNVAVMWPDGDTVIENWHTPECPSYLELEWDLMVNAEKVQAR
ncbi:hypothetical protein DQ384_05170 [Sphaerisporangium album]|uniref:Uncharacterized protein n=1 Tax=Sphaerisporangium album TaxID=509200 RepID=A0A367FNF9_9ACTN|nr:hypothetical protein DQ384_05170 [Sphaerisporangium album]